MKKKDIDPLVKLHEQLLSLLEDVGVLSKKSPHESINKLKLQFINKVLSDANGLLKKNRPFADFSSFTEDNMPSNSDVALILSQYAKCMEEYRSANMGTTKILPRMEVTGDWDRLGSFSGLEDVTEPTDDGSKEEAQRFQKAFSMLESMLHSVQLEIKELSKKKPDGVLSQAKITLINGMLADMKRLLGDHPSVEYLVLLDKDDMPQYSDAVLVLAQYTAATENFKRTHDFEDDYDFPTPPPG